MCYSKKSRKCLISPLWYWVPCRIKRIPLFSPFSIDCETDAPVVTSRWSTRWRMENKAFRAVAMDHLHLGIGVCCRKQDSPFSPSRVLSLEAWNRWPGWWWRTARKHNRAICQQGLSTTASRNCESIPQCAIHQPLACSHVWCTTVRWQTRWRFRPLQMRGEEEAYQSGQTRGSSDKQRK